MRIDQIGANTSCISDLPLGEAVERIRQLGFQGITLLAFAGARHKYGRLAGFWFRDMSPPEQQWLRELVVGFKRRTLHAPFADLPLFTYDPRVEQLALDRVKESIDAAQLLEAQMVTVHANPRANVPMVEYWDDMVRTFQDIGEYAAARGVRIGLETGFPNVVEEFVDLLEAVGHHAVAAVLDSGHMVRYIDRDQWSTREGARQLNLRLIEMTRQLGPLIAHCHLHDVRAADWMDHASIGRGVIDFRHLLEELQGIGYEGMLELELEEPDDEAALLESKGQLESLIREMGRRGRGRRRAA